MWLQKIVLVCACFVLAHSGPVQKAEVLELSVIHLNDFHARFEQQSVNAGTCKPEEGICIGGISRVYTAVHKLLAERKNPILLNAGDNFQGTLWYNLFKWNATQLFMNMLPFDAYVLGNHEFDDKIEGLVPFMKHINAPIVISNINDSLVPEIQGLYKKSIIMEIEGKKIGIVGVMLSTTNEIASTGDVIFLDEIESVNKEASRLVEEDGVFTVIVLSHSGYGIDQEIAKNAVKHIGLIVGAHSHSFLYTGTPPSTETNPVIGPYPTEVQRDIDGKTCLVVQAFAYTKYLGDIKVRYDEDGEVVGWEGQPLYLGPEIEQDAKINDLLEPYRQLVVDKGNQVLGQSNVFLDKESCRTSECNLGNLIADAMVYSYVDKAEPGSWTYASLAIMNAGGIRTSIEKGDVTYADMVTAQPFENTFDVGELQGKHIKAFLEQTAEPYRFRGASADVNLMQLAGFQVVYDLSKPAGSRIKSCKVRCHACTVPIYEDLDLDKYYRMVVPSFVVVGGDGFLTISDNLKNHTVGEFDMDVFERYLVKESPIIIGVEGRMVFEGDVIAKCDIPE